MKKYADPRNRDPDVVFFDVGRMTLARRRVTALEEGTDVVRMHRSPVGGPEGREGAGGGGDGELRDQVSLPPDTHHDRHQAPTMIPGQNFRDARRHRWRLIVTPEGKANVPGTREADGIPSLWLRNARRGIDKCWTHHRKTSFVSYKTVSSSNAQPRIHSNPMILLPINMTQTPPLSLCRKKAQTPPS